MQVIEKISCETTDFYQNIENETLILQVVSQQILAGSKIKKSIYEKVVFSECVFYACHFENIEFKDCIFENCSFEFSHFKNSVFSNCNFDLCTFVASSFKNNLFIQNELTLEMYGLIDETFSSNYFQDEDNFALAA